MYRVGILALTGAWPTGWGTFPQALRDIGYVEGQTMVVEYRSAEDRSDRLSELAAELVRLKVDVIVVGSTPAALAARKATETIPIVFLFVGDPVGSGLVASLSRPGGNITGVTSVSAELGGKRLELLRAVLPTATPVAVLMNQANPTAMRFLTSVETAARAMGVTLQVAEARTPDELDGAFAAMTAGGVKALVVGPDVIYGRVRRRIVDLAGKHRLPAIYEWRGFPEAGGLMSYGAVLREVTRRGAVLIDKILKGAKPTDTPVEQSTQFELVINLKTAKALGLTIPPSVLARADELI
jgi:putative ABC transport system substrate-binding protein